MQKCPELVFVCGGDGDGGQKKTAPWLLALARMAAWDGVCERAQQLNPIEDRILEPDLDCEDCEGEYDDEGAFGA